MLNNNFHKKVAVIVPSYNGKEYLPDLFESLKKTKYPSDKWKLIFVDDTSPDDSLEYAREKFPMAHFIINKKNLGFTGTNNVGTQWAIENNYDYLLLLNQDTIVTPDWLNILVSTMESDEKIGAVQPKILLHPKTEYINNLGTKIHFLGFGYSDCSGVKDENKLQEVKEVNYCSGSCVLLNLELIKKIGLFDYEMFFDCEDLDLGWRIKLNGYKNVINPKAIIYHKYKFSSSKGRFYHTEKNRFIILYKNYKTATRILLLPMLLIMEFGVLLFSLKNGWFLNKIKSYFFFFKPSTWKYLKKAKAKVQKRRIIKDREMIKNFTATIEFQEIQNPLLKYIGNPIMKIYYKIILLLIKW